LSASERNEPVSYRWIQIQRRRINIVLDHRSTMEPWLRRRRGGSRLT